MAISSALTIALSLVSLTHVQKPSSAQIVARCQKAYDSVQTLEVVVNALTGKTPTTAHFYFARPGKFRVTGRTTFGTKYDLLIKNKVVNVYSADKWQTADTAEMGVATLTGTSGSAITNVSSLLLHTAWGSLSPDLKKSKVVEEKQNGRDCYRLEDKGELKTSVWIDRKTFFLVRTNAKVMGFQIDIEYGQPIINKPIPAAKFTK